MLSGFNQYSKPEIELQNRIACIEIAVNGYVEKENTELYKETLNVTGTKTIEVTYSAQAKNAVATVSGGTLNSAELCIKRFGARRGFNCCKFAYNNSRTGGKRCSAAFDLSR